MRRRRRQRRQLELGFVGEQRREVVSAAELDALNDDIGDLWHGETHASLDPQGDGVEESRE